MMLLRGREREKMSIHKNKSKSQIIIREFINVFFGFQKNIQLHYNNIKDDRCNHRNWFVWAARSHNYLSFSIK